MKKINILVALAALLTLVSCVHEFPDPVDAEVKLRLQYDTELPIYQIVDWVTKSSSDPEDYDTRYVIRHSRRRVEASSPPRRSRPGSSRKPMLRSLTTR